MTQSDITSRSSADGLTLHGYAWTPDGPPRGVVQIAHGMSEHAGRYGRFAAALNAAGFVAYGFDHRGHGRTAGVEGLGHMAERDGWARAVADLGQVTAEAAARHPGLPVILFGHSMGSFMAQRLVQLPGPPLQACILCGSNGRPPPIAIVGRLIARAERFRLGGRGRSQLIDALSFGAFNKRFMPARTAYDWLSRDPAEVDKYLADPFCGNSMDPQFWIDFLEGLEILSQPAEQARIPKQLPFLVISGGHDPVSAGTRGLRQLLDAYQRAGIRRVESKFYAEARHELLNETCRDAVTADVIRFIESCL